MKRLSSLKPRIATLPPRLGATPGDDRSQNANRQILEPWRKWYHLAQWKRLRLETFSRDLFTCQMDGCGKLEGDTSKLVCDHVVPHRGNERLFFDPSNLQTLCKPCHDSLKQKEERADHRARR